MPSALDRRRALALGSLFLAGALPPSHAAGPPVELIVPFPAGGSLDGLARVLASALVPRLAQDVVVENIGGASGALAVKRFLQRRADGQTLLLGSLPQSMLLAAETTNPVEPIALGKVASTDYVLVSGLHFPGDSLDDFVRIAGEAPGRVSLAHPGQATLQYLTAKLVEQRAGVELLLVPYSGSAPMVADLAGGQVDVALIAVPVVRPLVRAGRLKVLGVLRDPCAAGPPGWPCSGQSHSLQGIDVTAWAGLFALPATPPSRIGQLRVALAQTLRAAATRSAIEAMGSVPADPERPQDGPEFAGFVRSETQRFLRIQQDASAPSAAR